MYQHHRPAKCGLMVSLIRRNLKVHHIDEVYAHYTCRDTIWCGFLLRLRIDCKSGVWSNLNHSSKSKVEMRLMTAHSTPCECIAREKNILNAKTTFWEFFSHSCIHWQWKWLRLNVFSWYSTLRHVHINETKLWHGNEHEVWALLGLSTCHIRMFQSASTNFVEQKWFHLKNGKK